MFVVIGLIGVILFIIAIIMFIMSFVKKNRSIKSKSYIVLGLGLIFEVASFIIWEPSNKAVESKPVAQTQQTEAKKASTEDNINKEKAEKTKINNGLTKICKDTLGNNFVRVAINQSFSESRHFDNGRIVLVTTKYIERISNKSIRYENINQARKVFKALYTSDLPIESVVVFTEADMIDNYGNKSKDNIFKFTMDFPTAQKVNWKTIEDVDTDNFAKILDDKMIPSQFYK